MARTSKKRIAVLGAGSAAKRFIDTIQSSSLNDKFIFNYIFDDNKSLIGNTISGVEVIDLIENINKYSNQLDEIIIAIPSCNSSEFNRIHNIALSTNKKILTIPSLKEILNKPSSISSVRDIDINDLIGRNEMEIDYNIINAIVNDKVILITGGAGSIGSVILELCVNQSPKSVICIDNSEYNTYKVQNKLKSENVIYETGDISDLNMMDYYFNKYNPDIVFHAAALKHVNLQENDIRNSLLTNFYGTENLLKVANRYKTKHFVLISTDKAVNPTNNMGLSKRMAEMVMNYYQKSSNTKMSIVRFGNVIGSSGSVLNYFNELIKKKKPITITHPKVARFFMSIEEACFLVLQSVLHTKSCQMYMLDMGEEILIEEIAKKLIILNNLELNKDIKIEYIGLKKGEKLNEELQYSFENAFQSNTKKLIELRSEKEMNFENFESFSKKLLSFIYSNDKTNKDIQNLIKNYFDGYL